MKRAVFIIALLLGLLTPCTAADNYNLMDDVADILKLRMSPDEVADSALVFILKYSASQNGQAYEICEKSIADQLIPWAEKHNASKSMMARLYDELSQDQGRQGKEKIAEIGKNCEIALKYAEEAQDYFRLGRVLEHYSLYESKYGDAPKGFELAQKAIEAYKKSPQDADRYITRCYYYQAIIYLQYDDMDGLRKVIEDMRAFADSARPANRNFHLYNLYSVEEAYYGTLHEASKGEERKKYAQLFNETSLKTILLLETAAADFDGTSVNPVWNYYNRAVMFINDYDRPPMDSIQYYVDKAISVSLNNKKDDVHELKVSTARLLAEGWMKNGSYAKAKDILVSMADDLEKSEGINNIIIDKIEIFKDLEEIAREEKQYDDALVYSDSIRALERRRFSLEQAQAVKELEVKYQTKETELALARSESRRATTLMWLFAAAGLLLVGIVVFVVYADRQRRRRMSREMEFARIREDIGRQLTRQYVEGLENERRRMSRELHDGVCNDLLAIQMRIAEGKTSADTARLIDSCRESVRRISHDLMPPEFDYASIDEVIRYFVAKQAESAEGQIAISYNSVGADWQAVPDYVSLEVYRIVQEAVGNAVKHSGASEINVSVTLQDGILTAEIADNGVYNASGRKGLGIESMRRRARSINGEVDFVTDENRSSKVIFRTSIPEDKDRKS